MLRTTCNASFVLHSDEGVLRTLQSHKHDEDDDDDENDDDGSNDDDDDDDG